MFSEQRKHRILLELERNPAVRVVDLGRTLRVSVASIRRDLTELQRSGLLKRTHGGAVSNHVGVAEPSLAGKRDSYRAEKAAIGRHAATLVQPGDTIFLDAGSTTREIALALRGRRGVTVVTNALTIAWELAGSDLDVILTGGQLRRGALSQIGPLADQTIAALHVNKLFMGANGVDLARGITTSNVVEARTKRTMIAHAREVIVVADRSKVGRVTFGHVCGLDRVHILLTDDGLPREVAQAIERLGVAVHLVPIRRPDSRRRKDSSD